MNRCTKKGFFLTPSKLWLIKFSDWSTLNSLNICHFSSFFIGLSLIMRRNALCKAHAWKAVKTSLDALFLLKTCRRPTASQCHLCISRSHLLLVCEAYPKILLLKHPIKNELSTIMDCGNLMNCSLAREDPLVCRDGIPVIFSARCIWHLSPLFHFLWFIDKQTYRQQRMEVFVWWKSNFITRFCFKMKRE